MYNVFCIKQQQKILLGNVASSKITIALIFEQSSDKVNQLFRKLVIKIFNY